MTLILFEEVIVASFVGAVDGAAGSYPNANPDESESTSPSNVNALMMNLKVFPTEDAGNTVTASW